MAGLSELTGIRIRSTERSGADEAPRPLRPHWRVRDLVIVRRTDLRPGERERNTTVQHLVDRWLRDPIARSALVQVLGHTAGFCCRPDGFRGDDYHCTVRKALLEAFRRRELIVLEAS